MACLHPISWINGWILTKLAQLYCWDRDKNWLDFGDVDPIFKVTRGLRFRKMVCLHPFAWRNGWILTKHTLILLWPWPYFQDHTRSYKVLAQIYCWDIDWFDFSDHEYLFKVIQGLRMLINGLFAPYCHMYLGHVTDIFYFLWKEAFNERLKQFSSYLAVFMLGWKFSILLLNSLLERLFPV